MPIYFAYGSNMDVDAMRERCPGSVPLGPARLMNHRVLVMRDGWASVQPRRNAVVHGLLWRIAPADLPALDRYEEVGAGLYRKMAHGVLRKGGVARALVYVGHTGAEGAPQPGYMEAVLASARALGFPNLYLRTLAALCPGAVPGCGAAPQPALDAIALRSTMPGKRQPLSRRREREPKQSGRRLQA